MSELCVGTVTILSCETDVTRHPLLIMTNENARLLTACRAHSSDSSLTEDSNSVLEIAQLALETALSG